MVPSLKVWAQSLGGDGHSLPWDFHPHGSAWKGLGIYDAEAWLHAARGHHRRPA